MLASDKAAPTPERRQFFVRDFANVPPFLCSTHAVHGLYWYTTGYVNVCGTALAVYARVVTCMTNTTAGSFRTMLMPYVGLT